MSGFWLGVLGNVVASALITGPALMWRLHVHHERLLDKVRAEMPGDITTP